MKLGNIYSLVLFICLTVACNPDLPEAVQQQVNLLPDIVDFNFHIKPIISDNCFKCHGPDENMRQGELRLDIQPNNLNTDHLIERIVSSDPKLMMPPPESNLSLSDLEKAMVIKWIEQGSTYKDHWAFVSPEMPTVPELESDWAANEIDHFILDKLSDSPLSVSSIASKHALIRRASIDLIGLPPNPNEIKQFIEDDSDEAFDKLIDRLLDSPHYGERMALEWLDVARYADSHGYQDDGMRNTWPWRDWVIKAYNENLPYDDFITWQLAGDLLENPTKDQLLATCFNRNHPQTQEGGVVDEEYRVEYVADRTNTFGKALMGLTTECARCHDHKYDPISQKEYYSLYAYFNNNNETGIVPYNGEASPTILLPTAFAQTKIDSLKHLISLQEENLVTDNFKSDFENWYATISDPITLPNDYKLLADYSFESEILANANKIDLGEKIDPDKKSKYKGTYAYYNAAKHRLDAIVSGDTTKRPQIVDGYRGKGLSFIGDTGIRLNRDLDIDRNDAFTVSLWVKIMDEDVSGPIFNKSNGEFEGYRGWICKLNPDQTLSFQVNHVWPDNSIDFQTKEKVPINEWINIAMSYDGSSKAAGVASYINGLPTDNILHKDNLNKSILHGQRGTNWTNLPFLLGKEFTESMEQMQMDELKVYNRRLTAKEVMAQYEDENSADLVELSKEQCFDYYLTTGQNKLFNKSKENLTALRGELNQIVTDQDEVMIMQERKYRRPTYILDRGMYDHPTDEVSAEIPAIFSSFVDKNPSDRLELTKWLTHRKHPLTSRVAVNRIWMMLFGRGIVATQEDFGNQGNLPSHPELLDHLALTFVDMGWDTKRFIKYIMSSSTYRQQSVASDLAKEIDPENMFYSYFSPYRLSAENIRDAALAGSGLLVKNIGGPSVYPYQPPGLWETLATRNAKKYNQQHGDSLYRRSMYTIWKRSSPPPSMMTFDAPDRYYCVVSRQKTATPLQSLIMMNDPQYLEASRVLAEKMISKDFESLKESFDFASLSLVSRSLTNFEQESLLQLYNEFSRNFKEQPSKIKAWLSSGEYKHNSDIDETILAAYTVVASTIMNFDEFIMKR